MKCTNCGTYINETDKFCKNCGEKNKNDHAVQYSYSRNYSNTTKSTYNTNHEAQFNYSHNYSNQTKPSYNLNSNHEDQYYSKYSFDPSKYSYATTYTPSGDDKYVKAYIGTNYEHIKNSKISLPALFFGAYYLLYRKVWNCALIYIIINAAAQLLLGDSLSTLAAIILNIYTAYKFKDIYLKKVDNHVERIKQENLDKTNEELINICKKKGGVTIAAPIIGFFGIYIIIFLIAVIFFLLGFTNELPTTESTDIKEEIVETPSSLSYTLPSDFSINYESDKYKIFNYKEPTTSTYCYISTDLNTTTSLYTNEEDYLTKHMIFNSTETTISEPSPVIYNNNT